MNTCVCCGCLLVTAVSRHAMCLGCTKAHRPGDVTDGDPILTMVDMGDSIYLSAQTVRKEDVEAFCARLLEMSR